jgi:hypothetical protein
MLISMSALLSGTSGRADAPGTRPPVLDVVVPVHNEETDLEPCLRRLARPPQRAALSVPQARTVGGVTLYDLSGGVG